MLKSLISRRKIGLLTLIIILIFVSISWARSTEIASEKSPGAKRLEKIKIAELSWQVPRVGREVQRIALENGMVVYLMEDRSLPTVEVNALIRTGQIYEPVSKVGLVSLTGSMLRSGGTVSMTPDSLNNLLEFMAITIETSIGTESGSAYMFTLSKDVEKGMAIFAEILTQPRFDSTKLELEKTQIRESILRRNDSPREIVNREFAKLIYGDHVYGSYPEWKDIKGISRNDLFDFHRRYFLPNNVLLAISGDFDSPVMLDIIKKAFANWQARPSLFPQIPEIKYEFKPGVYIIEKDVSQAYIRIGHLGIKRDNPDRYAIALMNYILGGGSFTSRLTTKVRSNEGLAYSVGSSFDISSRDYGLFSAHCQTKSGSAHRAISLILDEIKNIAEKSVEPDEFEMARDAYINQFVFSFTTPNQIVSQLMNLEYNGYPLDYYEKYLDNIRAVTIADIQRVARQYLKPEYLTIMIVGKPADFDKPLDTFGKITLMPLTKPEAN